MIDPFQISHPTAVQTSLYALALFARFDPTGRYLGTGRTDGSVAIWDLDTRAAVRTLDGHVKAVTSIEFSFRFDSLAKNMDHSHEPIPQLVPL